MWSTGEYANHSLTKSFYALVGEPYHQGTLYLLWSVGISVDSYATFGIMSFLDNLRSDKICSAK